MPDLDNSMLMAFEVEDEHQIENTRQVIEEFFALCGFSALDKGDEVVRSEERPIKVYIPFVVHKRFQVPYRPRPSKEDR